MLSLQLGYLIRYILYLYCLCFRFIEFIMLQRKPVIVVLIWLSSTIAHLTALDIDVEKLSNVIATSHSCRADSITGMAVSIVKDGRTLLSRGYGVTTQNGNTPVVSSTRFNVASLTKAVTAALLVKVMAESGK